MEAHGKELELLAEDSNLAKYFTFGAEERWTKIIKLRIIFPWMYLVVAVLFHGFHQAVRDIIATPI